LAVKRVAGEAGRTVKRVAAVAMMLAVATTLAGCVPSSPPQPTNELTGEVTVFAAASLTDSFQQIADDFEHDYPGVSIQFSFGGSSGLAQQLIAGAPADVFAAASPETMQLVTDAGVASTSTNFASNTLEIAVPAGNPGGVTGPADLANPNLAIALCAVGVPCGAASEAYLTGKGITASVDTYEQDVKAVLTKVELGEVDAGLVYVTDVKAAGDGVEGIPVDSAAVDYPITTLTDNAAAHAFVDYVLSAKGQAVLAAAGFGAP
jgi:molybdate transport system substrate-binding protein